MQNYTNVHFIILIQINSYSFKCTFYRKLTAHQIFNFSNLSILSMLCVNRPIHILIANWSDYDHGN